MQREDFSRLLVVDDEAFNLQSMKIVLKSAMDKIGLRSCLLDRFTDYASDGQQALNLVQQKFREEKELYGCILMDCQMPIMDGYRASQQIRDFLSQNGLAQPYIVACTGNIEDSQIKQAFEAKFDEVIGKPVTAKGISTVLTQVLDTQSFQ